MSTNPWGSGHLHCQSCDYEVAYQGQPAWANAAVQKMIEHLWDAHGLDALGRPLETV